MNQYLVVIRCIFDDLPYRLCNTLEEAQQAAREAATDCHDQSIYSQDFTQEWIGDSLSDVSDICIVEFVNGKPTRLELACDLEGDAEPESEASA